MLRRMRTPTEHMCLHLATPRPAPVIHARTHTHTHLHLHTLYLTHKRTHALSLSVCFTVCTDLLAYLRTLFSSTLVHIPADIRNLFYLSATEHLAAVLMVRSLPTPDTLTPTRTHTYTERERQREGAREMPVRMLACPSVYTHTYMHIHTFMDTRAYTYAHAPVLTYMRACAWPCAESAARAVRAPLQCQLC
jgi:hypothetical protein